MDPAEVMWIGCGWLIAVNAAGFVIFGYDKRCAVEHRWRVPEKTLFQIGRAHV